MSFRDWALDKIEDSLVKRRMSKLARRMEANGYPGLDPADQDEAAVLSAWDEVRYYQSEENVSKRHRFGTINFEGPDVDDVDNWS